MDWSRAALKICMVTPHLPPDQAANALLPQILRDGLVRRGHEVSFVAFAPTHGSAAPSHGVTTIRRPADGLVRKIRLSQMMTFFEVLRKARRVLAETDVVHVHSNTFMNQVAAFLAHGGGRPFILTHYGTEIWHFRRRRPFDPFLWMNRHAAHVTYYSRLLLARSLELGVEPRHRSVVYPPAAERFRVLSDGERLEARRALGVGPGPLILNVKRLHPLAGQRFLIEAMPAVHRRFPDARAWIIGEGESRTELEEGIAERQLGSRVRLLGLVDNRDLPRYYAAADIFVLPSRLEAFPTVAAEALACGTPVISADHPGGREIHELFPADVRLVPREDTEALGDAIRKSLDSLRRCSNETLERIEGEFRPAAAVEAYIDIYRRAHKGAGLESRDA